MSQETTRETQYQAQVLLRDSKGLSTLGLTTNQIWQDDPRHLLFLLARYKFVAKMLIGKKHVLEVGCGDAFGTRLIQQEVERVTAIDFDPVFVRDVNTRMESGRWHFECIEHDIIESPILNNFDAAYSCDVLEHIPKIHEHRFVSNISHSLGEYGVFIVGTPSVQSQLYASKYSREGHVNCKNHSELKELLEGHFHNVFIFSMNDEVVHTGFYPMAHYLFALCVGRKN